jgi:dihydrofolate reductase
MSSKLEITQIFPEIKYETEFNVKIIVAATRDGLIGKNDTIPWNKKLDIMRFRGITIGELVLKGNSLETIEKPKDILNVCFMGKESAKGIPEKFFPLANRICVVITSNKEELRKESKFQKKNVFIVSSYEEFYQLLQNDLKGMFKDIFICGGAKIYSDYLNGVKGFRTDTVFLTRIFDEIPIEGKCAVVPELALGSKLDASGSLYQKWSDSFKILERGENDFHPELNMEFLNYVNVKKQ